MQMYIYAFKLLRYVYTEHVKQMFLIG